MKPIVKWAGGKTQLLKEILPLIPNDIVRYYEPFVGGGAVFFALNPNNAHINDFNKQLINVYEQVKNNVDDLILHLEMMQKKHNRKNTNKQKHYLTVREAYNKNIIKNNLDLNTACEFIYLNKAGYNGLYRVNQKGLFNVPFSKKDIVSIYDEKNLRDCSELLGRTYISSGDFEQAIETAHNGDFVFFDSPYYKTFDTYQKGGFSEEDHIRLNRVFNELTERGVRCLLTNSAEQFIIDLYRNYNIRIVDVKRMINSDGKNRKGKEVIITNY